MLETVNRVTMQKQLKRRNGVGKDIFVGLVGVVESREELYSLL